jgi:hypothetical protein
MITSIQTIISQLKEAGRTEDQIVQTLINCNIDSLDIVNALSQSITKKEERNNYQDYFQTNNTIRVLYYDGFFIVQNLLSSLDGGLYELNVTNKSGYKRAYKKALAYIKGISYLQK